MRSGKLFLFLITWALLAYSVQAQIYAPSASDSLVTSYGTDKIFIFNRPEFGMQMFAPIVAVSVDGLDDWTFQWSVYDPGDSVYKVIPGSGIGRYSRLDTITVTSGYLVSISRGLQTDTFRVWIIINDLDIRITNKDEADTLLYGYYDCSSLDLHVDTVRHAMSYYNPFTHQKLDAGNMYNLRWTTDNPEVTPPSGNRLLTRVNNPPWKDTWYKITITDRFGISRSDSVIYKSVIPKSVITHLYIEPWDELLNNPPRDYMEQYYNYEGVVSAPALFRFDISESQNMENYELDFGDGDSVMMGKDSLVIFHEYEMPGTTYKVILTTRSKRPFECAHSDSTIEIILDYATEENFIMPNVFTPGDGDVINFDENELFRTQSDVSVIYIDLAIFTRTGKKVHEYQGNIRDWAGWNGLIRDTGQKAPTGVYFYVITRLGAYQDPDKPVKKSILKGFIHLYRE